MTPHEAKREARRVGRMTAAEWADHRRRVKAERSCDEEPEVLGPAIVFRDRWVATARLRGMDGDADRGRVLRRAANRRATVRQCSIVLAWLQEATDDELWYAHIEDAYSWRQLAAAIHACGIGHFPRCRQINALSTL